MKKLSLLEVFDDSDDDLVDRANERAYRREEEGRGPKISLASIEKKLSDERHKRFLDDVRNSKPPLEKTKEEKLKELKEKYYNAVGNSARNSFRDLIRQYYEPDFEMDKENPDGWDF